MTEQCARRFRVPIFKAYHKEPGDLETGDSGRNYGLAADAGWLVGEDIAVAMLNVHAKLIIRYTPA